MPKMNHLASAIDEQSMDTESMMSSGNDCCCGQHCRGGKMMPVCHKVCWTVVILLILGWWAFSYMGWQIPWVNARPGYQAVFLTNGQVYFGKVLRDGRVSVVLKDVYYLQVVQPLQQGGQPTQQQQQGQQLSLAKLGNELHGPVDEMRINRSQMVFIEDLKDEGQVVQAIIKFKTGQLPASQAPAQPAPEQPAPDQKKK
ncbi:MAG: hypothetical protein V1707_00365 [bacterium]